MFPTVVRRPGKLSNRNCCSSDDELAAIIRKRDDELAWADFGEISPVSNCTATYEEQLYFVPLAFAHQAGHPTDALEYMSGFVQFFIRNADVLERGNLLVPARSEFDILLRTWTRDFRVVHFDRDACARKGWSIEYDDFVENSQAITELLERLLAHESFGIVSEEFVRGLASDASAVAAAWFLEIARAASRVQALLTDPSTLESRFASVTTNRALAEQSPTYWNDLALALGTFTDS